METPLFICAAFHFCVFVVIIYISGKNHSSACRVYKRDVGYLYLGTITICEDNILRDWIKF